MLILIRNSDGTPSVVTAPESARLPTESDASFCERTVTNLGRLTDPHFSVDALPTDAGPDRWTIDWTAHTVTSLGPDLAALKALRVSDAWTEMERRLETASVSVTVSAGAYAFGIDATTQDNILKALLGVVLGITPNPRSWTPKGATSPISVTHDDLKAIGGAIGGAYDGMVQAYFAHKAAIAALSSAAAIAAYDITAGWPH